ncbi:hypothetical protein ACFQY9_17910 [Microvirga aerilata]|uniref:hypothetical protein n=1 Tax=Microvirga aerilata TaxID=670292 RepID=UPI003631C188
MGQLSWDSFVDYGTTEDENDYIVYDEDDNLLYYDPDGSGAVEKVLFAKITISRYDIGLNLSASDFYVV